MKDSFLLEKLTESVDARVFLNNFFLLLDNVYESNYGFLLRSSTFNLIRSFIYG